MTDLIAQLQSLSEPERVEIIAQLSEAARAQLAAYIRDNKPFMSADPKNQKQMLAYNIDCQEIWFGGASMGGKGLALDTPIPTPDGWKTMGSLKIGDRVFDENGKPCLVYAVSEIHNRKCFRVKFSDSSELIADDVHQWVTFTVDELNKLHRRTPEYREKRRANRPSRTLGKKSEAFTKAIAERNAQLSHLQTKPAYNGSIKNTQEIADTLMKRGRHNHAIRVCGAIEMPEIQLPIQPYTLGAWLGDGTRTNGQITGIDPEIFNRIREDGFEVSNQKDPKSHAVIGLIGKLRDLNLLDNKHIPEIYFWASEQQRFDLLRGLMDTDGHAALDGGCEFDNINERLADDVLQLVQSLGIQATKQIGTAKLNGREICPKYRIKFTTSKPVFHLSRKLSRLKETQNRRSQFRFIVSCEEIESTPTRCISVTSESKMYLAGRSFIPTHNSYWAVTMAFMKHHRTTIFRRSYPATRELRKICEHNLRQAFGKASDYVTGGSPTVVKPPTGKRGIKAVEILLASLQRPDEIDKFQGNTSDCFIFDEAVQFTEEEIRGMSAWLRPSSDTPKDVTCQLLCTFNPPLDAGGLWVIRYLAPWLDPEFYSREIGGRAQPGQVLHRVTIDKIDYWYPEKTRLTHHPKTGLELTEPFESQSVTFIQSLPTDNSYLDDKTKQRLLQHPEARKLFYGDMSASIEDDIYSVVRRSALKRAVERWKAQPKPTTPPDIFSLDPALTGDNFVLTPIWILDPKVEGSASLYFGPQLTIKGSRVANNIDGAILEAVKAFPTFLDSKMIVDAIGTAGGVALTTIRNTIKEMKGKGEVIEFVGSRSTNYRSWMPPDADQMQVRAKFTNTISAAWITFGERLEWQDCPYMIPPSTELEVQLLARKIKKYESMANKTMESKEDFKNRLRYSPDEADSLIMGYWFAEYELCRPKVNW